MGYFPIQIKLLRLVQNMLVSDDAVAVYPILANFKLQGVIF